MNKANQVLDCCSSTNDLAKALAEQGAPHGTWISSRIQENGRGRLGRKWESLEGNLFLSVVVRIPQPKIWSWIPLTTGVAILKCLNRLFPGLNFQLKWPNDLWLASAKFGGILCEGSSGISQGYVVIGVGINCIYSPDHIDQNVTNLTHASLALGKGIVHADDIRAPILNSILNEIQILSQDGPQKIQKDYDQFAAFPQGMEITWGQGAFQGQVIGLGPSSELLVRTTSGEIQPLLAEDVQVRRFHNA